MLATRLWSTIKAVYSFGHYGATAKAELLQFYTKKNGGSPLEISKTHMVFVAGSADPVAASSVKVGDELISAGDNKTVKVTKISNRVVKGLYAPFTASGTIMVNGIMASNYVVMDASTDKFAGIVSHQWAAHAFNAAHRMYCNLFSSSNCSDEKYTPEGLSYWVALPFAATEWILSNERSTVVRAFILVPILISIGIMQALEIMLLMNRTNSWAVGIISALVVVAHSKRCTSSKKIIA